MKYIVFACILAASVGAITLEHKNTGKGIFSSMIADVEQDGKLDDEI